MKLAHLILVHKGPQQVQRLLSRLINPDSDIYIHIDLKCNLEDYNGLLMYENVFFIKNRIEVNWAGYSMLQATLNGFQEIIDTEIVYSHINLLSGQDYLLHDIKYIQNFLFKNTDRSFLKYREIDNWVSGQIRLKKYSFGDFSFPKKYALEMVANYIMPKRKMPLNLVAYGQSTWLTITPVAAKYVINYLKQNKKIRRFFKMTWSPDELVIQTILLNSPLKNTIVNNNLRYIELGDNVHPTIFTSADLQTLLNSGKLFARKFDVELDTEIFDLLDASMPIDDTIPAA